MSKRVIHQQAKVPPKPSKKRSIWRYVLWALLLLLLIFVILAVYIWVNRFSLVEDQIKKRLTQEGFDIELSIIDLTENRANIKDLKLSQNAQTLMRADTLELTYEWRAAIGGEFERIDLRGVTARITVDETGKIDSPLSDLAGSQDGSDERSVLIFPSGGIHVKDGEIELLSPFGVVTSSVNAKINDLNNISADIEIAPAEIKYGDVAFTVSGAAELDYNNGVNHGVYDLKVPIWSYKKMTGEDLSVSGQGSYRLEADAFYLDGPLQATLKTFIGSDVAISDIALDWDGAFGLTRGQGNVLLARGDWTSEIDSFSITRESTRQDIAQTLSLEDSLARTPVTADFAAPLTDSIARLFTQAKITGAGWIQKTPDNIDIKLARPLSWQGQAATAELRPAPEDQIFTFSKDAQEIRLMINASLSGAYPMEFSGAQLILDSTNGRNIKGTRAFDGRISLPKAWRSQTPQGGLVRLAPTTAKVSYGSPVSRRALKLTGEIDFDGNIPGGYVEGLKTSGVLTADLGTQTRLFFEPELASTVKIDRFLSDIPWIASDISFELLPSKAPVFTLGQEQGELTARLSDLTLDLENFERTRSLKIQFGTADIAADIGDTQTWNVDGQDIVMTSDNMPSVGTEMTANTALISAYLDEMGQTDFTINSPSANVKTEAVNAKGLAVQVAGAPDKFRVNYQNGDISFTATDFPPFDMFGYVDYENENWFGKADSFLPFKGAAPLKIDYRFVDSRGFADVDIPEIRFRPRGLQPQTLIPLLRGKISGVDGVAKVKMSLEFADGEELKSSGSAQLIDMSMGTMPGPMSGVNTELKFASFFPLVSEGRQIVTIEDFDPGFPLKDGEIEFEAIPGGFEILRALWPLGTGSVSLSPAQWRYDRDVNRVELRVDTVELEDMFDGLGGENFYVTGTVNGVLPIKIDGLNVEVENGTIGVAKGGVIKFRSAQTDQAADVNVYAGYAFDSLKEFHYEELEATFDGALDGLITLRLVFQGSNPDVLYGLPFKFNVKIEGELLNIVRNFQLGTMIAEEVKKAILNEK